MAYQGWGHNTNQPQNQGYGQYGQPQHGGGHAPQGQSYHQAGGQQQYNQVGGYSQYGQAQQQGGYGGQAPSMQNQELMNWFVAVDADRTGQITANELQSALTNNNWSHFNAETCRLMIGMFDRDKTGTINFEEFCHLWRYIQDWRNVFNRYDADRSGAIEAQELHRAFSEMGYRLSLSFVQLVLMRFDTHSKRALKLDSFIQCCVMLKSVTDNFRMRDTNMNGQIQVSYEDFMCMCVADAS